MIIILVLIIGGVIGVFVKKPEWLDKVKSKLGLNKSSDDDTETPEEEEDEEEEEDTEVE